MDSIESYTREYLESANRLPHCDMLVLHRPGTCDYCDRCPELQQYRIDMGYNFTNESDPDLLDCPSWQHRPQAVIERWSGNVPYVDLRPPSPCVCYPGECPQGCDPICPVC